MPAAAAARTFPEPVRSLPPGTKLDLLPRGTEPERVADWLSGAARKIGGVVDVHLVSSKSSHHRGVHLDYVSSKSRCTSSRLSRATGCRPAGRAGRTATHQPTETHQPASATQPAATTRTRATLPSLACAASPLPPAGGGPRTPRRAARQGPLPSRREIEPRSQPRSSRDGSPASALSGPLPPGAANVGKSAFLQSTPGPRCRTPASARLPRPHSSRCAFGGCQPSEAATPALDCAVLLPRGH